MNEGFALHEIITDQEQRPLDYRFLAVNPAFEKLTGLRAQDIVGRTVLEVMPRTEDDWIQRFGQVALRGAPDSFENYSGELRRWYAVSAYSPRPNQFCAVFSDITARKTLDQDLRQREELFRVLFETMAQGVVYQDAEGRIIRANPAAERILGLSLDQMRGRASLDPGWRAIREDGAAFPGGDHPAMVALRTGKPVENVVMGVFNPLKNEQKWININAMPQFRDGGDKPFQVYATFEDLTARFQIEKELRTTKDRLDLAFAAAGMGWWDWDVASQKVAVSPQKPLMLGYEPREVGEMVTDWISLIHPDDHEKTMTAMRLHLDGKTPRYEARYRLRMKDGSYKWVYDRGLIVARDPEGAPGRLIGAVQEMDCEIIEA
ncbi:MAG: PAS domain S-box protein [Pseudomonadota bacterium]